MNNLTPQQATQALNLKKSGYSIRDIAAELGLKKYWIEQFFIQHRTLTDLSTQALPTVAPSALTVATQLPVVPLPVPSSEMLEKERQILEMKNQIEAEWVAINAKARTLAEQERQLALKSNLVSVATKEHGQKLNELATLQQDLVKERAKWESRNNELNRQLRAMPNEEELYNAFKKRARKEKLVDRHNGLVQELLDNCEDCTWSGEEVDDYLEKLESLKDKIVAFCQENSTDPTGLLIYQGLVFLSNDVEQESDEQNSGLFSGTSVEFDYSPEYQAKIQALLVETFEDIAPEGLNELDENNEDDNE